MRQKTEDRRQKTDWLRRGSAIILAVVLTTLLAIIGVLFLFSSRVDSVATSAVGDNHDLKLAVDTVIAQISQTLTTDVARGIIDPNQYVDYPDPCNPWLACLEPYQSGSNYFWQQVSNIYGSYPWLLPLQNQNVQAQILPEYQPTVASGYFADADGDGVSDSFWVQIQDINSSKGKPVYAAIRIIDNGGMLNINTADKFDPVTSVGSTQLDINFMALAALDHTHTAAGDKENRLLSYRCGSNPSDNISYAGNVVWQYGMPTNGTYTPFDISDELKLRNRYIINYNKDTTRIESLWTNAFDGQPYVPRDPKNYDITNSAHWFWIVSNNYPAPCLDPCTYDNRHIATTYNCDRIIDPNDGSKMFNINSAKRNDVISVCNKIREALEPNESYDANQIAVNLINYIDTDSNIVYFQAPGTLTDYFGFSRPCVYISQIAENSYLPPSGGQGSPAPIHSYAIELFKPYSQDDAPNGWKLVIDGKAPIIISNWSASQHFHVLANIVDPQADIQIDTTTDSTTQPVPGMNFSPGSSNIGLRRNVIGYTLGDTLVDSAPVPAGLEDVVGQSHSFERDINPHRCIRKVWNPNMTNSPTLGLMNGYDSGTETIQAHPPGKPFTNIGEIGQIFRANAYLTSPVDTEADVRLNIADPCVQNIFKYLTVTAMDPFTYTGNQNETRIKGRININTAPWFVLAQLPWLSYHTPNYELARSIISYRDKINIAGVFDYSGRAGSPGFKSIGELMGVINPSNDLSSMSYYQGKGGTIPPVLMTPKDSMNSMVGDEFEERDVIFDRISNLVTVRSDVFTAYILVRIGPSGPQKRVIAIFDRSGVVTDKTSLAGYAGKVKIVAIQQVPEPNMTGP